MNRAIRRPFPIVLTLAVLLLQASVSQCVCLANEPDGTELGAAEFNGFLRKYCFACPDNATTTAKLSLASLSMKAADFQRCVPVYDNLPLGQMPPQEEPQPSSEERKRVFLNK